MKTYVDVRGLFTFSSAKNSDSVAKYGRSDVAEAEHNVFSFGVDIFPHRMCGPAGLHPHQRYVHDYLRNNPTNCFPFSTTPVPVNNAFVSGSSGAFSQLCAKSTTTTCHFILLRLCV